MMSGMFVENKRANTRTIDWNSDVPVHSQIDRKHFPISSQSAIRFL